MMKVVLFICFYFYIALLYADTDLFHKRYEIKGKNYHTLKEGEGFRQMGKASWYGTKFHGRKTANGERFDMNAMTAAHKILPFNTLVKVTDVNTNRYIIVRINDRGPFSKGRIIDLSKEAAKRLGVLEKGEALVYVEVVEDDI